MQLIFEKSQEGGNSFKVPENDFDIEVGLPENLVRESLNLPEVSEAEVLRHYTNLSRRNFGVDIGFYPLGSCTMKYNPRINEQTASLHGFSNLHPCNPENFSQGSLQLMYELQEYLKNITGFCGCTLQPAAGAHSEFTGIALIKAYFKDRGEARKKIIIPDSAHGTNPATCNMAGFEIIEVKSDKNGCVDLNALRQIMTEETAGLMITIPNTLGIFDKNILEITKIIHEKGGLVYMDGANMNALLGMVKPAELGVDMLHLNLHKTFSTPHGGGGPGAGALLVNEKLMPYLPIPIVIKEGLRYKFHYEIPKCIGRVRSFYGNFGILVRAYTYIRRIGMEGLSRVAKYSCLNANYIKVALQKYFHPALPAPCMHECVFDDSYQAKYGITTNDIAKRLLDFGFHAPTIYFPLTVHGAIMIEPTETETKETLDQFISAMKIIAGEARTDVLKLKNAPFTLPVRRVDAIKAARNPVLRYNNFAKFAKTMKKAIYKVPNGKLLKIFLDDDSGKIVNIKITGDFFTYPEENIEKLEKSLRHCDLEKDKLFARVNEFLMNCKTEFFGLDKESLVSTILQASSLPQSV